ncbi:unnamed protein product [Clonostachys solani]|uniref:Uncharacterized protein n=1 Tax=Clonostachys solani TaxID=160281 RepID=A0A9P0ED93_9HYPO|nr:unnamed protein product [Clonostachys solani]
MPVQLLPASAAAFAPRASSVNVVLGSKVEPWLTQTLKRVNRVKRPLNSVPQHQRCLTEILSSPNAIWNLASIMLPTMPEAEMPSDPNQLMSNHFQMVHIEAYVVHVDMVLRNEVAYKLNTDTIDTLVQYHEKIHCADAKANTHDWSEKEQQCKKLHEDFIQAVNRFVFRTHVSALEGLEEEGFGELLNNKSQDVKNNVLALMKPLVPPPPRVVEVIRQPTLLPSTPAAHMWSQGPPVVTMAAVDPWRILPSSPSVSSVESTTPLWTNMGLGEVQMPSPTPSYTPPHTTAGFFFSSPEVTAPIPTMLPSMLAPMQCGVGIGMGGFGWDRYQEYATIM